MCARSEPRSVAFRVAGQKLTLKSDADAAYVQALAERVTERVEQVRASSRMVSTQALLALAALQLADELAQLERKHGDLRRQVRQRTRRILDLIQKETKAEP